MKPLVTYEDLSNAAETNRSYLSGEINHGAERTVTMAWDMLTILSDSVDGIKGGFGLGYPFHSVDSAFKVIPNPQFEQRNSKFLERVESARLLATSAIWECSPCQSTADFSPRDCGDCTLVTIKPRDVMKNVADVDLFVIADTITAPTLSHIQDTASENGFNQSDFDATGSLERINQVMTAFRNNQQPDGFMPADIHVVQESAFINAMYEIEQGHSDISLPIRPMYAGWKPNTKIDFWFDFTFSGTFNPDLCSDLVNSAVNAARKGLTDSMTNEEIETLVRQKSPRSDIFLTHEPTRQLFYERLNTWRKT